MTCWHDRITFASGHPHCLDCEQDFTNEELAEEYARHMEGCTHENQAHCPGTEPPTAFCPDCHSYLREPA